MERFDRHFDEYFGKVTELIQNLHKEEIMKIISIIKEAYQNDRQIFVFGNGGSAANASHFANEFNKGSVIERKKRFRMISLVDNIATLTAWGNDMSYEDVFSEQLKNFIKDGDVVIGISCSGNSKNVLKAIEVAKNYKVKTIGLTAFSGGKLKDMVDVCIHIKDDHYGRPEDIHMMIFHYIGEYFRVFEMK